MTDAPGFPSRGCRGIAKKSLSCPSKSTWTRSLSGQQNERDIHLCHRPTPSCVHVCRSHDPPKARERSWSSTNVIVGANMATNQAARMRAHAEKPASCWEKQIAPIWPAQGYLTIRLFETSYESPLLLCDPLTGLVAYPSFAAHLTECLPALAPHGLHLAIGDVDDLTGYVTAANAADPTMFGHLAGNDCMRRVGRATRKWAEEMLSDWPFWVCSTFGGDEVIVAAAGGTYNAFNLALNELVARIRSASPRPCSFACATTVPMPCDVASNGVAYRRLVARVDKALFHRKQAARDAGARLDGALVDVGAVELL